MSILIKGMEMPKNCIECPMQFGGMCYVQPPEIDEPRVAENIKEASKKRATWCPLIELPPHGRLIDADAFLAEQRHLYCENCARRKGIKNGKMKFVYDIGDAPCRACGYGDVLDDLDDAPTIIEAEPTQSNALNALDNADVR